MIPSTSLSPIEPWTRVRAARRRVPPAPPREERPEVVQGLGERRGAGRVVGAVEEHVAVVDAEELEAPGPPALP